MIAVVQRIGHAQVDVAGETIAKAGKGLLVLLGVKEGDQETDARLLAEKISKLRIFEDENGKMNRSVNDVDGSVMVVSNFTLLANYRHGNRPDFFSAAKPAEAERLYDRFTEILRGLVPAVSTGRFGAEMKLSLMNDGPVTLVLDSAVLREGKSK